MWSRLKTLLHRRRLDQELDEEIRFHLEMLASEKIARGTPADSAWSEARREFGGVTQVKEYHRDLRGIPILESLIQDVRLGWRTLLRNSGFTAVVILTLALGIGANTAMFTVLNAVLLQSLPYPEPERLMVLLSSNETGDQTFSSAEGVYLDWRERNTSFESLEGGYGTGMIARIGGRSHRVNVVRASAGLFDEMGVQPVVGRRFDPEEDQPGHAVSVLLDEGFWIREFGRRSDIVGQRVILDDRQYVVSGVMPAKTRFAYTGRQDMWLPLEARHDVRTGGAVIAIGRLKPGVTREAAQAEMESLMRVIGQEHREDSKTGVQVRPLQEWITSDMRLTLQMLAGAAAFTFLICCANVANLMLVRSMARQPELAVRASLGAGKFRLIRQLAVESLLLATAGGLAGGALAAVLIRLVPSIDTFYIPRASEIVVDWRLVLIAALTTLTAVLIFGVLPAWQTIRGHLSGALQAITPGPAGKTRSRDFLVAGQFALALVLLTGAGMLLKSLAALLTIDTGFERDRVITIHATLPWKKYDQAKTRDFAGRLRAELERMPGVRMVTTADRPPLEALLFPYQLTAEGAGRRLEALGRHVGTGYFDVLGIPVLAGRTLVAVEDTRTPVPVLVNARLAQELFNDVNPVGKLMRSNYSDRRAMQIVGVTGNTRQLALTENPGPQLYVPAVYSRPDYLIARLAPNSGDLSGAIRQAVLTLDPELPAPEISSMQANFNRYIAKPRFYTLLLGTFASLGVLLAALGIYGVTSWTVSRRTREFGIRMAVGARPVDILGLVLSGGARLTITRLIAGLAGAVAVTRALAAILYGAKPKDPVTILCVLIILAAVGLIASFIAARRATRVNPAVALRCD